MMLIFFYTSLRFLGIKNISLGLAIIFKNQAFLSLA